MSIWARRLGAATIMLLLWAAFSLWQYNEYRHEEDLARTGLRRQSESVGQALLAGIRSHRRMGRFFEEQLQLVLDELVATRGVVAVRIDDENGTEILSAGLDKSLLPSTEREVWQPAGLQTVRQLEVNLLPGGGPGGSGGRGPAWLREELQRVDIRRLTVTLLMDRSVTDESIALAAQLRVALVLAGGLVIGCLSLLWFAYGRSLHARTQAELLQAEARRLDELSQAAAGLAHETRNPLGVIRGGLQRLSRSKELPEGVHGSMKLLMEECDRVTARINQFLAYARPRPPELQSVDLRALADDLRALLQPDLEAQQIELELSCAPAECRVQADPELLRQILFNLLQNAISFSRQEGEVTVKAVGHRTGNLRIEVADRGSGVDDSHVESLFVPYFTTRPGGAGLGLAIVRRLVQAHGWTIQYRHREGGGSIFRIEGIRGEATVRDIDS